jgi:hypothetical protein
MELHRAIIYTTDMSKQVTKIYVRDAAHMCSVNGGAGLTNLITQIIIVDRFIVAARFILITRFNLFFLVLASIFVCPSSCSVLRNLEDPRDHVSAGHCRLMNRYPHRSMRRWMR